MSFRTVAVPTAAYRTTATRAEATHADIPTVSFPLIGDLYGAGDTLITPTFTRAAPDAYLNWNGTYYAETTNIPRFEADSTPLGLLIEGSRVFSGLYARDFTNAAWVKTNVSAAKDAVGIDGTASGACTLTADANDGTALQTVTIGSAAYTFSVFVRRKTGTGTIEITDNNGTNYTDITASINSNTYTRVSITRTQANPVYGFRLGTSGDEIEVDFADLEAGSTASSPIPTEGSAVTRAADVCSVTVLSGYNTDIGILMEITPKADASDIGNTNFRLFGTDDSRGAANEIRTAGSGSYSYTISGGGGFFNLNTADFLSDTTYKVGLSLTQEGGNIRSIVYLDGVEKLNSAAAGTLDHSNNDILQLLRWDSLYNFCCVKNLALSTGYSAANLARLTS